MWLGQIKMHRRQPMQSEERSQQGSRGCCKTPADSRQNTGGDQGESPRKSQDHYILCKVKRGKTQHFPIILQ